MRLTTLYILVYDMLVAIYSISCVLPDVIGKSRTPFNHHKIISRTDTSEHRSSQSVCEMSIGHLKAYARSDEYIYINSSQKHASIAIFLQKKMQFFDKVEYVPGHLVFMYKYIVMDTLVVNISFTSARK